jgi:hypothetical protein
MSALDLPPLEPACFGPFSMPTEAPSLPKFLPLVLPCLAIPSAADLIPYTSP